ncbi:MAG: hypothetical protein ACLQGP_03400 [Isosphaeraceae bacterium]
MSARGIMVLSLVLSMTAAGAARAEQISSTTPVNAFLNLGATPYPGAAQITTGDAQPWYDSSELSRFFGGQPTVQQQQSFDNAIVQDVQQAFSLSGVPITVTDNPYVPASHTLSLVSNTASMAFPGAIGTSQIGGNGFSFINAIAPYAQSLTQLEWIIAHNMSHELMLTFGVGENYDTTGNYIDARMANWSMIISPTSTFSPAAAAALRSAMTPISTDFAPYAQLINPASISNAPEPTTWALWGLATATLLLSQRRKARASA